MGKYTDDAELSVQAAKNDCDTPVTVIELTLERAVESGRIIGMARAPRPANQALLEEVLFRGK